MNVSKKDFKMLICNDDVPDLSYLGTFTNTQGKFGIEHDVGNSRTYNWFNANNVENRKQAQENYDHMIKIEIGDIGIVGVRAVVNLKIQLENTAVIQTITSPGLWGIEIENNPDEDDYVKEVYGEECDVLTDMLKAIGVKVES